MMMKMAVKAISPYLNKITDGLDAMASDFGVEECFLMIRKQEVTDSAGKKSSVATLVVLHKNESGLAICQKNGKPAEYPIEKLIDLISGDLSEEDED